MRILRVFVLLTFVSINSLTLFSQSRFTPSFVSVTDETNGSIDHSARFVWAPDNNLNTILIAGESYQDFTCFGIGVLPSVSVSAIDISIEYKLGTEDWKKSDIEYSPEEILRDDLYWTDLNFSENSNSASKIEFRITLPEGVSIDSVKLHVINVDFKGKTVSSKNSQKAGGCPAYPTVITRAVWLDPYYTQPAYTPSVITPHHVVIHHGASPDTYTDGAAVVRGYWNYHVYSNGWSDIAYNYLTDKDGNIYKGRMNSDSQNQDCRGAHSGASNNESIGVNFLGNSDVTVPTEAQLDATAELLGWWFNDRGYDPTVSANITLQSGGTASVPRICGHKDVNIGGTSCPGGALYADLPDLRNRTNIVINACNSLYTYGTSDSDYIDGVELDGEAAADISNTSTGALDGPSYNDYSATHSADLIPGHSYTLQLTNGGYSDETLAAWIDYDDNGSFEISEKIGEVFNVDAAGIASIDFTVPLATSTGSVKMRVRSVWSDVDIDATTVYAFGEAEDYGINIITPCTTPAIPVSLSTTAIDNDGATFNWTAGSPAGTPTVVYYWAVGLDGTNPTYSLNYIDRGTTTSTSVSTSVTLDPYTNYEWTIKAHTPCDATQSSYASYVDFTTSCITPGTPQTLTTSDITNTGITLDWAANATAGSPDVTYYWAVNTSTTVDYETNYVKNGTTTGIMAEVYALLPGTNYYWTVKAETSCGVSSSSSYASYDSFSTTSISVDLTWTGATSTDWDVASNWSPAQIPTKNDNVTIPDVSAGANRYPNMNWNGNFSIGPNGGSHYNCKSLTINAGAEIIHRNYNDYIYIEGSLNIAGTFKHRSNNTTNIEDNIINSFQILTGGELVVQNGGNLIVGLFDDGTNTYDIQFDDILIDGGIMTIEPGGEVIVMDNFVIKGSGVLNVEGGDLWVKYYGAGSNAGYYGLDLYAVSTMNITAGNIYICGQYDSFSRMADWNSSATVSITGGTIYAKNEQSSGSTNNAGFMNFGGHSINNLTIDRNGAITYLDINDLTMAGDLTISSGTISTNGLDSYIAGDVTNNGGTLASTSGTITLEGADNIIGGSTSSQMAFNNLIIQTGASYTWNPTGVTNFDVNGSFELRSGATLRISNGKFVDIYSSAADGEYIKLTGTVNSSDNYNNSQEFDFNNTCDLYITGEVNADIRIFDDITTLKTHSSIFGDLEIYDGMGTLDLDGSAQFTIYGDFTNDNGLVANTGAIILAGVSKEINGDSDDNFYDLKILSGASYTLNPSSTNGDIDVNGQFEMESSSSLTISSGKYLDLYAQSAFLESVVLNGDIIAIDAYDGTRDIDLNNTVELSGSGNINADLRVFDNTSTLISDFVLDGDFETYNNSGSYQGVFVMTDQMFTVNGDFTNDYRFIRGTGTVKFAGSDNQIVDCGCSNADCDANVEDTDYRRLNKVIVECATGKVVKLANTHMRTSGDFTVNSGTFSTGDGTGGYKINIYGITTIEDGAYFNIGRSGQTSGDVADFHDNLIVRGEITTDRDIIDGYAEVRTYASRLFAEGDTDEIYSDVQVYLDDATEQLSDLYISGDLIIQTLNEFKCTDPNHILTIGGHLYIYHNFTHYGTVNLYGDFRENTLADWDAEVCDIASSTFNMYGNNMINFNPSSGFGDLNIISGTRSINESGGQTPYTELDIIGNLTIENGATLDAGTDTKDIDIEGNWIVQGTGAFVPGIEKVTFSSSSADQYIYLSATATNVFYQMDLNNSFGELILQSDCEVSRQIDLYQGGISLESNELYLSGATNSINSFMDGGSFSGYIISETEDNASTFKRNYGTSTEKWFPLATSSGASLAMIIFNNNGGVDNLGDVAIATYPTGSDNTPLPSSPQAIDHLTTDVLTTDVYGQMVDRYWQIDASGTVNDVDLTFTYVDDSWDSFDMTAQRWDGSDWDSAPATSAHNTTDNTVTVSNITGFSPWALTKKDWQLPIELLSFDAKLNGTQVDLVWTTANEYNNDFFEVERSLNLQNIDLVGKLLAAGFSNSEMSYAMIDKNPYTGISYYRLKQTDFDGTSTYSDWVAIEIKQDIDGNSVAAIDEAELSIISAYPNPTSDNVKVLFYHRTSELVKYSVIDYTGRLLTNGKFMTIDGENELNLNFGDYQDGVYIVIIQSNNSIDQVKVIKRR